jgi:hypothetical protein
MNPVLRPIEVLQRNVAIGVRFWDPAAATSVVDGLIVNVFPRSNPRARKQALPNRIGIYVAHSVSGLKDFEFDAADPAEQAWTNATKSPLAAYRIEMRDPFGRFHPLALDADLPVRGLISVFAPALSPPPPIIVPGDTGSPPSIVSQYIPLFPVTSRPVPHPLAVVYAQLREFQGTRVPAWSLLGVSIHGILRGLGLADRQGRVAVMFPYPEPPRIPLASPPEARSDFSWTVQLSAYSSTASPALTEDAPEIPDLADILAQLATPCAVIESTLPSSSALRLNYRIPLTARTAGLPPAEASFLMLSIP